MAKKILAFMFHSDEGVAPNQVAEKHGFRLISDPETLLRLCRDVIADHPEELDVYRHGGKYVTKMTKLFTGKVMAVCNGNAHPERLQEAVEQALESASSEKEV
jgi:aspartyl-tRNA(Asn)/glutamyl-tRNA(Gln) amidotransferase subunit B